MEEDNQKHVSVKLNGEESKSSHQTATGTELTRHSGFNPGVQTHSPVKE